MVSRILSERGLLPFGAGNEVWFPASWAGHRGIDSARMKSYQTFSMRISTEYLFYVKLLVYYSGMTKVSAPPWIEKCPHRHWFCHRKHETRFTRVDKCYIRKAVRMRDSARCGESSHVPKMGWKKTSDEKNRAPTLDRTMDLFVSAAYSATSETLYHWAIGAAYTELCGFLGLYF